MCGIAGVVETERGARPTMEGLERMAEMLVHRGPDEDGFLIHGRCGLAHRRLSIIDLRDGQQPMESHCGRFSVVFNGEIYNFLELRREMEARGHGFRTRSDTEVMLALYAESGVESFDKLAGMFTCAFWDREREELVLLRDRIGKKPLYYYLDDRRLIFGSELKALLAHGGIDPRVRESALLEYLAYGYVVGDNCILEGVRRVPPGHYLVLRDGRVETRPYWRLEFGPDGSDPDETEAERRVEQLISRAVEQRMISDVPLGAFLSGGLDSSVVVAMMARHATAPVKTYAIGFGERRYSELDDARVVAQHLETEHHELIVHPQAIEVLPDLVWHLDEPFGDSSAVPTYYVCKAAREHVTVALSGDGGDETFAGYRRYLQVGRYERMRRVPTAVRRGLIRPLVSLMPFTWPGYNYLHAMANLGPEDGPRELGIYPHILDPLLSADLRARLAASDPFREAHDLLDRVQHLDPVSQLQYLNTCQYLPDDILVKVDRMSMANSLEVRAPLLDHRLVEYVATLPVSFKLRDGVTKYILRKLCARLLPASVLSKGKQGFAIPKAEWFKGELREHAREILLDRRTLERGYFRPRSVRRILEHHATGRRDYSNWIWNLLVLEMWFRTFIDRSGDVLEPPASGTWKRHIQDVVT